MRVKFAPGEGFYSQLKTRVDDYFSRTGFSRHDSPRMFLKIGIILGWFLASYTLLVFAATTWWQAWPLALSLGLAMAGIGFNLGHDGGHGSISRSPLVNGLMARMFDLLGGSSYIWHFKHNVFHHSYPNIAGADEDIDSEPMARLSPHQPYHRYHRFQYLYMWLLYGFLPVKWQFYDDFKCLARSRIAQHPFPRPRGWQLVNVVAGKAFFLTWAVVVPLLLHPLGAYLLFFAVTSFTLGVTMSVVFQLAHCTEQAEFPNVTADDPRSPHEWAVHQVRTTVDFARGNPVLDWYLGGLNYQIEHHLFPHVTHIHYPAIAGIVEATCAEHGVRYFAHEGLGGALASHQRWLWRMGRPAGEPAAPAAWPEPGQAEDAAPTSSVRA